MENILQFFFDTLIVVRVVEKLKKLQEETEPILMCNQKYKALVERMEKCTVDEIKPMGAMEAYLSSVNCKL